MKKTLLKKSVWQSILSVMAFGIFLYFAVGSIAGVNQQSRQLGDGVIETAKTYSSGKTEVLTGKHDDYGRWHGAIKIETGDGFDHRFTEEVTMVNGKRHGQSVTKFPNGTTKIVCYNMGSRVECSKSAHTTTGDSTAFQILKYKYPWYLVTFNMLGFNNEYVEAYLDTIETVLYNIEFTEEEFFDNYYDVIDILEDTPYDSIIQNNYTILLYLAFENMKNGEFRLAAIDYYRADDIGMYNILQNKYPGYVSFLNQSEITNSDLEAFCSEFDAILESYGPLDLEDPFFPDSADTRMYNALDSISNSEKSATIIAELKSAAKYNLNNNFKSYWDEIDSDLKKLILDNSPSDVAPVIQLSVFMYYISSDVLRNVVWDAYAMKKGVISLPTVTSELTGYNSATSATVWGHVIEDGGSNVTTKGIVWATFYNPTIDDNLETRGDGTLSFSATLEGLTEGETYYARAFATNSIGTAYGNCIKFVAGNTSGIDDNKDAELDFNIYPNPASSVATFSFQVRQAEPLTLTIIDLNGKMVLHKELNNLLPGKNEVQLNIAKFENGIYNCLLTNNSTIKVDRKILIAR